MKKIFSVTKVLLLVLTLTVVGLGAFAVPAQAAPGDITIYCDGSDNLCVVYEDPDVIIEFWFGKWTKIVIEM